MQSVFNTKDDDVGVNGVRLIMDEGKMIFRETKPDENDGMSSLICEITTISGAEDDDTTASFPETLGDSVAKSKVENGLSVNGSSDGAELVGGTQQYVGSHDDCKAWPAVTHNDCLSAPRMSLRQKTSPSQKTSPTESRRKSPSKAICPRGRGGRLIRTRGFRGCRGSDTLVGLCPTEGNDEILSEGIDRDKSNDLQMSDSHLHSFFTNFNEQDVQSSVNNREDRPEHKPVVDGLIKAECSGLDNGVPHLDNVNGLEPVAKAPSFDRVVLDADRDCEGETEPAAVKNEAISVSNSPKKSSIFDATSKELFYKRRKVSFSKESQTNTCSDLDSISLSPCTQEKLPAFNDSNRKSPSSRNRRKKVSTNGIVPRPIQKSIMPKPVSRRNHSSKEIEDLIEGSINVAKIVDCTHQKIIPSAPSRPPIVVIKSVSGKYTLKTIAKSDCTRVNTLTVKEHISNCNSPLAVDANCRRTSIVPTLKSEIINHPQVLPEKTSMQLTPLFHEVPLLLVKTVNNCSKNVSKPNDSSTAAEKPQNTFKVLPNATGTAIKMAEQCDNEFEPFSNQTVKNGSPELLKTSGTSEEGIRSSPIEPPRPTTTNANLGVAEMITRTTSDFNELLSMPRATKCKAIQKISAIVSRKRKVVGEKLLVCNRKRSIENNSKGNETESGVSANQPVPSVRLPPPPLLTPCSMPRTEELQRKNLQGKLMTSNLTIHPNLQCRVNIPLLEKHPLVSRLDRGSSVSPTPSHLLPASTVSSAEKESVEPSSLEIEKRSHGRTRSTSKTTRFSRNGRRIGRPPIRSLVDGGRDVSASESDLNSPFSIVNRELRRLRLLPSTFAVGGSSGCSSTRSSYPSCADQPLRSSIRQTECAFRYREIVLRKHDNFTQIVLTTTTRVKNGLNVQVLRELKMALDAARTDKNCHVVLLNGTGSVFCSGIDLISLVKDGENTFFAKEMATAMREFSKAVMSFPKTLVAAVNGAAVGLGVTMLPLFDLVYASDKATFYTPYIKLGQIPEGGATYSLPFCMGFARANGLLMCSRRITAAEAFECGLVTQVLWPSAFMEGVIPQVQALAKQPLQTMGSAKALIRYHSVRQLEVTLDIECRILSEQWSSPECIQSIREFLDKEEVV